MAEIYIIIEKTGKKVPIDKWIKMWQRIDEYADRVHNSGASGSTKTASNDQNRARLRSIGDK